MTLDFDLALTGCQNPISAKYQSVPWGSLGYITRSVSGGTVTEVQNSVPLHVTATTGGAAASCTYTINGTPANWDRVQLVYLGNVVFDLIVDPPVENHYITLASNIGATTGYVHTLVIGGASYTHTQLSTDTPDTVTAALCTAASADLNAIVTQIVNTTCSFGFWNYLGTGYNHTITVQVAPAGASQTFSHVQLPTDGSGDIAMALAAAINANTTWNQMIHAAVSGNNVILSQVVVGGYSYLLNCTASDGMGRFGAVWGSHTDSEQCQRCCNNLFFGRWDSSDLLRGVRCRVGGWAACRADQRQWVSDSDTERGIVHGNGAGGGRRERHRVAGDAQDQHVLPHAGRGIEVNRRGGPYVDSRPHGFLGAGARERQAVMVYLRAGFELRLGVGEPFAGAIRSARVVGSALELDGRRSGRRDTTEGGRARLGDVISGDSWAKRAGSGWAQVAGWYVGGFAWQSAHAGDTVTVKYSCQSIHNLYWGTALSTVGGAVTSRWTAARRSR